MSSALGLSAETPIELSVGPTSTRSAANSNTSSANGDTIAKKSYTELRGQRTRPPNGLRQLLDDASWYMGDYGTHHQKNEQEQKEAEKRQQTHKRRLSLQERRHKRQKEIEDEKERRQREWDALDEEERQNILEKRKRDLEAKRARAELQKQLNAKMKAEKEEKRKKRETQVQHIKRVKVKKEPTGEEDYYKTGNEVEMLQKAAEFFANQGGKMTTKRQVKPVERYIPPVHTPTQRRKRSNDEFLNKVKIEKMDVDDKYNSVDSLDMDTRSGAQVRIARKKPRIKDSSSTHSSSSPPASGSSSSSTSFSSKRSTKSPTKPNGKNARKSKKHSGRSIVQPINISDMSSDDEYTDDDDVVELDGKIDISIPFRWFTNISKDGNIDVTPEKTFMADWVYEDDIPSKINTPPIQAKSMFKSDFTTEHNFFKGQKVELHFPLSEYIEEYSLLLPKSEVYFNPFDELGKMMELTALTFFPEREAQMVVNTESPDYCIVGRYIRMFELYENAHAIIDYNVKTKAGKIVNRIKREKKYQHSKEIPDLIILPSPMKTKVYKPFTLTPSDSPMELEFPDGTPDSMEFEVTSTFGVWNDPIPTEEDLISEDGLSPRVKTDMELIAGMKKCFDEFNMLVDQLREEGSTFNVIRSRLTIPRTLVHELLNTCYSRTVLPECRKLKGYKAFSNTTYGELMPSFLSKVYVQVGLQPGMKFIDLGSGVGNCAIQAALEFQADAYGVEIMENASNLAEKQLIEFTKRCQIFGTKSGQVKLFGNQSFINNSEVKLVVDQCNVMLINNYLFDHKLNNSVIELLKDIKVGTKIISLKPIVPVGYLPVPGSVSILDRMKTTKHVYSENSVSWTFNGGYYYITEVVAEISEENFTVMRRRGLKPASGDASRVNLNVFTNNV